MKIKKILLISLNLKAEDIKPKIFQDIDVVNVEIYENKIVGNYSYDTDLVINLDEVLDDIVLEEFGYKYINMSEYNCEKEDYNAFCLLLAEINYRLMNLREDIKVYGQF